MLKSKWLNWVAAGVIGLILFFVTLYFAGANPLISRARGLVGKSRTETIESLGKPDSVLERPGEVREDVLQFHRIPQTEADRVQGCLVYSVGWFKTETFMYFDRSGIVFLVLEYSG